ncbi:MAG: TIGR04255 family protein [Candidatus Zixiibacteriota bacterium]
MAINEVFPNPTVKQVIFQIRFPNLFYIENKIGDFQIKIMKQFPKSGILYKRQLVFADIGLGAKPEKIAEDLKDAVALKIWNFSTEKNVELNIMANSLDISSNYHKTYNLEGGEKFRTIIEFVISNFIEIVNIPIIQRLGLRYIDECPIPEKQNEVFASYYNSVFPIERFNLNDATEMDFKTIVKRGNCYLRYIESLLKIGESYKLILDFDGFAENVAIEDYLKVTDHLHDIISNEYERTIKDPVIRFMKETKE